VTRRIDKTSSALTGRSAEVILIAYAYSIYHDRYLELPVATSRSGRINIYVRVEQLPE